MTQDKQPTTEPVAIPAGFKEVSTGMKPGQVVVVSGTGKTGRAWLIQRINNLRFVTEL